MIPGREMTRDELAWHERAQKARKPTLYTLEAGVLVGSLRHRFPKFTLAAWLKFKV